MSASVTVVGSGASGVHFALTLLKKGHKVVMLDAGRKGNAPVHPDSNFNELKGRLDDPVSYFLGSRFEGAVLPDSGDEYYGIPPSKEYIFDHHRGFQYSARGFAPLFSFAQGGLAEAWTAGCYPLNESELELFPFSYRDISACYEEVARRIGVTGADDDLARFMPLHGDLMPPLNLDRHSQLLLESYSKHKSRINDKFGAHLGRTRVATLSRPLGSRKACDYLGRCLWGCPIGALYTPSQTLNECRTYPGFQYHGDLNVDYFKIGRNGRIESVIAHSLGSTTESEFAVENLALAAGTLLSSKIVMQSIYRSTGERVRLRGLMDNRQVLVPFVNLKMIGQPFSAETYQYHLLGMGVRTGAAADYVHGQITTLKTAMLHPIMERLPFDLRTASFLTRTLHAALGIVNVNFRDDRRDDNYVTLSDTSSGSRLEVSYAPATDEPVRIREGVGKVKQTLRTLGCVVPPGMAHVRPMGASVHYAGTLPMTRESAPLTTTEYCQSRDFKNLFLADGSTFPFLPAKNITFSLMANAVRIAEAAF